MVLTFGKKKHDMVLVRAIKKNICFFFSKIIMIRFLGENSHDMIFLGKNSHDMIFFEK